MQPLGTAWNSGAISTSLNPGPSDGPEPSTLNMVLFIQTNGGSTNSLRGPQPRLQIICLVPAGIPSDVTGASGWADWPSLCGDEGNKSGTKIMIHRTSRIHLNESQTKNPFLVSMRNPSSLCFPVSVLGWQHVTLRLLSDIWLLCMTGRLISKT